MQFSVQLRIHRFWGVSTFLEGLKSLYSKPCQLSDLVTRREETYCTNYCQLFIHPCPGLYQDPLSGKIYKCHHHMDCKNIKLNIFFIFEMKCNFLTIFIICHLSIDYQARFKFSDEYIKTILFKEALFIKTIKC